MRKVRYLASVSGVAVALAASGAHAQTAPTTPAAPIQTAPAPADPAPVDPAAPAQATEEAPAGGDIVVTGIRASLQSAANIKRNASSIVDAISAEDMGAFPDQNIAESLQRVTGVQIQRDRGEGRDISIRGLDPKFSRIMLNGDGLVSISPITSINPNGPPSPTRSFDFTTLGSDFVQTLVVAKTPTPDLEEGGMAGTVDVRTIRPLDLRRNRFSLSVEGLHNTYARTIGPSVSGALAMSTPDGRFGISLAGDWSKRYLQTQSYQSSGQDSRQENQLIGQGMPTGNPGTANGRLYTNTGSVGTAPNTTFVDWNFDRDNLDAYRFNHLVQFQQDSGTRERQTYNLGLQWRPSDRLEFNFNGIYADYKTYFYSAAYTFQTHLGADPTLTGNRVVASHISSITPFAGDVVANGTAGRTTCTSVGVTPATGCTTATAAMPIDGLIDYYDLRGALIDNITKFNQSHARTYQGQLGATYKFSDSVRLNVQGSYVRARRNSVLNAGMDAFSYQEVLYDQRTDFAGVPTAAYGPGATVSTPSSYNSGSAFFTGFIVPQRISQRIGSGDLQWDDPLPWLTMLKVGYKHTDTRLNQTNYNLSVGAFSFAGLSGDTLRPNTTANGIKSNGIDLTNYMTTFGGSNFLSAYGGDSTFPRSWIGPNVAAVLAKYPLSTLQGLQGGTAASPQPAVIQTLAANTFAIREIVNAGYFRADFTSADNKISGNIGLRAVHTTSIADGFTGDPTTLRQINQSTLAYASVTAPVNATRHYWSFLPSLNLRYDYDPRTTFRFAVSQTMTRPDFASLVPSNGVPSFTAKTATIANTGLAPYYSINLDLGGEFSFGQDSLLSVALFQKYIRGFYVSQVNQLPITYTNLSGAPVTEVYATTQSVNGSDTTTRGVEVAFQQPFTFLPGFLSGFGTLLNYTFTDAGEIQATANGAFFPLTSVSRHAANAVLYYEKYGFSARAAYVYRSRYVETAGGIGGDSRGGSYVEPAGYLDVSARMQVTPYAALTFNAVNVLDTAVRRTNVYGFGRGFEVNGRTFTLGGRLTF